MRENEAGDYFSHCWAFNGADIFLEILIFNCRELFKSLHACNIENFVAIKFPAIYEKYESS